MLDNVSLKVGKKTSESVKNIMRDSRYPFENETLYYAHAIHKINQLWQDLLHKKKPEKIIDYYNTTISDLDEMKRNGFIDVNSRGIRKVEEIQNAL